MQGDSHASLVLEVKNDLERRGVSLVGSCGAFEITRRVAWLLRNEGAGLLWKPEGNNCGGFSVDHVVYSDGDGYDVLFDSGGANTPLWQGPDRDPSFPDRWRKPSDPGDAATPLPVPVPVPVPLPPPIGTQEDCDRLIAALDRIADGLDGIGEGLDALGKRMDLLQSRGLSVHF